MDIPLNTDVWCADGLCGRSVEVMVNPTTEQVTHRVLKEKQVPYAERVVPVDAAMVPLSSTNKMRW